MPSGPADDFGIYLSLLQVGAVDGEMNMGLGLWCLLQKPEHISLDSQHPHKECDNT